MVDKIIFDTDLDATRGIGLDSAKVCVKVDSRTIEFNPNNGALQVKQLVNPVFVYDLSGKLSSVTYSDGSIKNFSYSNAGKLISVITNYVSGQVHTKNLVYTNNVLTSVTESYA